MIRFSNDLTTLTHLKAMRGFDNADDDLTKLKPIITQASNMFTNTAKRNFVPYRMTRNFRRHMLENGYRLRLDEDLLSIVTLTNGDATVLGSGFTALGNGYSENNDPRRYIELDRGGATTWAFSSLSSTISVDGLWGYHDYYAGAWGNSLDTIKTTALTSTATTLLVNDANGLDDRGLTRFEVGDYLMIESEIVKVTDLVASSANELKILRAQNGTTGASHIVGTTIYVYRHVPEVKWAVTRLCMWLYDKKDDVSGRLQFADGSAEVPKTAPDEVLAIASHYTPIIRIDAV